MAAMKIIWNNYLLALEQTVATFGQFHLTRGLKLLLPTCFVVLTAAARSGSFPAQPYTWKNVTVKGGGFICGIVFNPTQKDLAYCRTDIGSSYKWDSLAKSWIPLTDWCGVGNLHGSESIATDPIDPQRVYIAAGMGQGQPAAILRSMNQGKTFQTVDFG